MLASTSSTELARAWFRRRMANTPMLQGLVLADLESLLQGKPAQFVEQHEDLREEVLWVCMTYGVLLAIPLERYRTLSAQGS